jgi:putative flippase GtrA
MDLLLELLFTATLGAVELSLGVLGGVAFGLPFILIGATTILGNLVALALALLAGERLQRWIYRRPGLAKRRKRVEQIWNRYGVLGVALLAPIITGAVLATVLALALGAPPRPLLRWMALSTALRGVALTGAAALGMWAFLG